MSKTIKFALISAAALSLVACTKEIENQIITEGKEVQLTFASEKPNLTEVDTKTAWNGSTIVWTKGDAIRIAYTVNNNWQTATGNGSPAKMYASDALKENEAGEVADFKVSAYFTDEDNASLVNPVYKFYGIYPSGVGATNFTNAPSLSVNFPTNQTPESDSFDKSTDIMYATSDEYDGIPTDRVVDLTWHRLVAHADISMRNLQIGSGETLESITITAQTDADLSGTHTLDITTGEITSTGVNEVIIDPTNLTLTGGAVEFWATTLPFTATELTFTVKTNHYTYVRKFTGINLEFKGNARNTLNVNMKLAQKFQDYTEDFTSGIGEFTTSGTSGIWNAGSYQGTYYMKGTSRISNSNTDGEGWLISPFLSINSSDSELSFDQSINGYFKNSNDESTLSTEATVWAREKGGEWQQITITYPTAPASGFTDFEPTSVSLSAFNGKTIQIGFKYIGYESTTDGGCGTWEISNFKVSNSEIFYYPSFEFTSATTKEVSFTATAVEFTYSAAHLTNDPTVTIKAGSDDIIEGTPTIANGVISVSIKANDDTENAKQAKLVVTCEGVTGIPELIINQAKKQNLVEKTATLDFSAQGYSNEEVVSSLEVAPITASFNKGSNSNAPKYYTTGTALRCYGGNTITLTSEKTIVKAEFTFASGEGSNAITANVGSYSNGTWTGSTTSVIFTIGGTSGHRRIQKIVVTYLDEAGDEPATPSISLSNLPTSNIAAAGDVVTINYSIENPATGVSVSASAGSDTWVNSFDYSTPGEISFVVDPKTTTGTRTATITVSYTGAEDKTFAITQNGTAGDGDSTTIPVSIATYASNNNWENAVQYFTINLDANVTATAGPSNASNTGKYYTTDDTWRFYANESATLSINAGTKTIESVTLTYTVKDNGTISKSGTSVTSGTAVSVNASSVEFTIGQSSGNKGKVFVTAISVTYK